MSNDPNTKSDGLQEEIVQTARTATTREGGRTFKFRVSAAVGDGKGHIGFAKRSAKEVSIAMPKALERARKGMLYIELNNDTIYHRVEGKHGSTKVIILPAQSTGIIAGGAMRAIFSVIGIKHVVAKIIGSRNPINVVAATLKALAQLSTPQAMKAKRKKLNKE